MSSKKNRTPGRPQGAPNAPAGQVVVVHQCPWCKKSERTKYRFVSCQAYSGFTSTGAAYSHIVKRRTKCANPECARTRIDTFLVNEPVEANPGEENEPE